MIRFRETEPGTITDAAFARLPRYANGDLVDPLAVLPYLTVEQETALSPADAEFAGLLEPIDDDDIAAYLRTISAVEAARRARLIDIAGAF